MATTVQRGRLGFETFFRRRSSSPESAKDRETNSKTHEEGANPSNETNDSGPSKLGKFFGQKSAEEKNESLADRKSASKREIDDASSQKTDTSKKSSKKKQPAVSKKQDEKPDDSEACKELILKDDMGQVQLAEIINNSIKEAVLNIVKEGVCPLADSLDRAKDSGKKASSSASQGVLDKENTPGSPKHLPSLVSRANKTFDSHLCRSQYQPSNSLSSPNKFSDHEREIPNQYTRELYPYVSKDRKTKSTKQKDKIPREASPKITRLGKGSSHFRTDNRRMTGNVNIYICSEANENAKDKKHKDKNQCNDDSETTSETKTCTSSLSVSTSKLVAALRKKQRKNVDDQSLSCRCDIPESSVKQYRSVSKIGEDGDVSCLCDDEENRHADFLDTRSSSSTDCICEDEKLSDLDFAAGSDLGTSGEACTFQDCGALSESASDQYASYNNNDFWTCNTEDCTTREDNYQDERFNQKQSVSVRDFEERCSCCNLKRCQKDRPSSVPCHREPRERNNRAQVNRCPCIIEEEDEDCCIDREEPNETTFTVCRNSPANEKSSSKHELTNESEKPVTEFGSGILKGNKQPESPKNDRTLQIASMGNVQSIKEYEDSNVQANDSKTQKSPKTGLFSTLKNKRNKSADREPNTVLGETTRVDNAKSSKVEQVEEIAEAAKNDYENVPVVDNEKPTTSFFYRSFKKAMDMVKIRKDENAAEENKKASGCSPQCLTQVKSNDGSAIGNVGKGSCGISCSGIENGKSISGMSDKAKDTFDLSAKAKIASDVKAKGKTASSKLDEENVTSGGIEPKKTSVGFVGKETTAFRGISNPEKRSKSKISTAIASRRSSAATTTDSSNLSIPQRQNPSETLGSPKKVSTNQSLEKMVDPKQVTKDCKCQKLPDKCDCCKKPKPPREDSYKCYDESRRVASSSCICCKKVETPKAAPCLCCPTCGNFIHCCICRKQKSEVVTRDPCNCCRKCKRPIDQCICCCVKQEEVVEDYCDCCRKSKCLCCCDEKSRAKRSHPTKCRQPSDFKDNHRQCGICCKPKAECRCNMGTSSCEKRFLKSMICIYCDNPQDECTCRAPIRKCSQCGLPLDVCNCKPADCCDCSGRLITSTDTGNEQTISVTAWKPRKSIRKYFARDEGDESFEEDCPCYDTTRPYGSDGLPYQKRGVFSTVMSELQQKMSGSVCCNVCRKVPCCCCCAKKERIPKGKTERRPTLGTIAERKIICPSQERSRSKSPTGSCKCSPISEKKRGRKEAPKICSECQTSPCRCRRSGTSPQKKCYYCKNSPCMCVPVNETANARQFRSADSSHYRRRNRGSLEKKINADSENNGYRGRVVVPSSESQRIRKYCYREISTKQHPLRSGERNG